MKLKHNIPLIYVIGSMMWGRFFIPVIALFYISSQVPLEQFTVIMSVFALTILLFELPTGVIADLLGKKKTLLLSRLLYMVEIPILAFMDGFWPFLIAKIISGIGVSLWSGSEQALLYDTLKKLKREKEHKRISGLLFTVNHITMAFVFIIGAWMFSINHKLPAIASIPFVTGGFILTFFLTEPYPVKKKINLASAWAHFKKSVEHVWKHNYVKYLIAFSLPIHAMIVIILTISSAYFEKIMIPVIFIGVLAFISAMTSAISSKKAHSIEERLGDRKSLQLIQIFVILGLLLMAGMVKYFGAIFYLFIPLAAGLFNVLINHYVNVHIETAHRATILSIKNMCNQLGIVVLFPLAGYITKTKSMRGSFIFLAGFFIVYAIILYLYSKRLKIYSRS